MITKRRSVVVVTHTYMKANYRGKWRILSGKHNYDITLVMPSYWRETLFTGAPEPETDGSLRLVHMPVGAPGRNYAHWYSLRLASLLRRLQPDILHIEEEPWSLACAESVAFRAMFSRRTATILFTWENIYLPQRGLKRLLERLSHRAADIIVAGSTEASAVLRWKGYEGRTAVLAQHGYDARVFNPATSRRESDDARLRVGYSGRLTPEKGIDILLEALAGWQGWSRLTVIGAGPDRGRLEEVAQRLGLAGRISWLGALGPREIAAAYRDLDVLVLPSRTHPSGWKEQFGRVLVEAMSAGVPVIGSDSGAIPEVVGPAGLIFREGNALSLRDQLMQLEDPTTRERCVELGLERSGQLFSDEAIAERTAALYDAVLTGRLGRQATGR